MLGNKDGDTDVHPWSGRCQAARFLRQHALSRAASNRAERYRHRPYLDLGQHWTIRCERPNRVVVGKSVRVRLEHVFPMVAGRREHFIANPRVLRMRAEGLADSVGHLSLVIPPTRIRIRCSALRLQRPRARHRAPCKTTRRRKKEQKTRKKERKRVKQNSVNEMTGPQDDTTL